MRCPCGTNCGRTWPGLKDKSPIIRAATAYVMWEHIQEARERKLTAQREARERAQRIREARLS